MKVERDKRKAEERLQQVMRIRDTQNRRLQVRPYPRVVLQRSPTPSPQGWWCRQASGLTALQCAKGELRYPTQKGFTEPPRLQFGSCDLPRGERMQRAGRQAGRQAKLQYLGYDSLYRPRPCVAGTTRLRLQSVPQSWGPRRLQPLCGWKPGQILPPGQGPKWTRNGPKSPKVATDCLLVHAHQVPCASGDERRVPGAIQTT